MAPAKLKLYSYPGNKNASKALIVAKYAGVELDTPRFTLGVDNKTPAFLKLNPNGKVRVMVAAWMGVVVWKRGRVGRRRRGKHARRLAVASGPPRADAGAWPPRRPCCPFERAPGSSR